MVHDRFSLLFSLGSPLDKLFGHDDDRSFLTSVIPCLGWNSVGKPSRGGYVILDANLIS